MLEKYYKEGFAAGPKESEDDFLNRIANVKKIVDNPSLISDLLIKGITLEKLSESLLFFKSNKYYQ